MQVRLASCMYECEGELLDVSVLVLLRTGNLFTFCPMMPNRIMKKTDVWKYLITTLHVGNIIIKCSLGQGVIDVS